MSQYLLIALGWFCIGMRWVTDDLQFTALALGLFVFGLMME